MVQFIRCDIMSTKIYFLLTTVRISSTPHNKLRCCVHSCVLNMEHVTIIGHCGCLQSLSNHRMLLFFSLQWVQGACASIWNFEALYGFGDYEMPMLLSAIASNSAIFQLSLTSTHTESEIPFCALSLPSPRRNGL
jgi:hypothetical protein